MARVKKELLNQRRKELLNLLVQEYILTGSPVSSGLLVDKYDLKVSPATVRNDFAYLEEMGYIYQPHLSAGRIPTDLGIQHYVETIIDKQLLTEEERKDVDEMFSSISDEIEKIYSLTVEALTRLTRCLGVAVFSPEEREMIKHLDLIKLSDMSYLLLVVDSAGNVFKRRIEIKDDISDESVNYVLFKVKEKLLERAFKHIEGLNSLTSPAAHPSVDTAFFYNRVVAELKKIHREQAEAAKVYRSRLEESAIEELIKNKDLLIKFSSFLEKETYLVELAREAISENRIIIKIGAYTPLAADLSIIAAPYRTRKASGIVGVIGPKRMNYMRAIGAARFISHRLIDLFSEP
jgi:heat-inducible transcriptional repressor